MCAAEFYSRRFDFLRLHHWAWSQRVIQKPFTLPQKREPQSVIKLLRKLIQSQMRQHKIDCDVVLCWESNELQIEFPKPFQILKQLTHAKTLPGRLAWRDENWLQTCVIRMPFRDGNIWCASAEFQSLEKFLKCQSKHNEA